MEFLGWYTTGGPPDQSDIHIHKQVGKSYSYNMYSENEWRQKMNNLRSSQFQSVARGSVIWSCAQPLFSRLFPSPLSGVWDHREPSLPQTQPADQTHRREFPCSLNPFKNSTTARLCSAFRYSCLKTTCPVFFQLPVSVYESVIDIINGEVQYIYIYTQYHPSPSYAVTGFLWANSFISCVCFLSAQATMLFAELTYTLATEEAERIGVDHVARMTATGTGENSTGLSTDW